MWRVFKNMVADEEVDSVRCVIDGLDECDEVSLRRILSLITNEADSLPRGLKLMFVSRETPRCIPEALSEFPRIKLDPDWEEAVESDIRKYVVDRVAKLAKQKLYSAALQGLVEKTLVEKSEGTFLWVSFVLHELQTLSAVEVEDCLRRIPIGLPAMYDRMLLQIRQDRREAAAAILRCTTLAIRPLNISELAGALSVRESNTMSVQAIILDQIRFCGCFILVENDIVSSFTSRQRSIFYGLYLPRTHK